jgi:hypothetical protein
MFCVAASPAAAIIHPAVMRPRHHELTKVLEQSTSVTIVYYYERIEAHKFNPIFTEAAQQLFEKYGNKLMIHQLDLAGAPIARRTSSTAPPVSLADFPHQLTLHSRTVPSSQRLCCSFRRSAMVDRPGSP